MTDLVQKLSVTSFGRTAFSYQHLTLTSTDHWATLGNWLTCLARKTIFLQVLCAANIQGAKEYQTPPSQGTNSLHDRLEPWRFISCAQLYNIMCV